MDYFGVIKRAAEITWKHKATWFFGVLYAIFQGRSGFNYNFNSSDFDYQSFPNRYSRIADALLSPLILVTGVLLILLLIGLSIFLGFLAKAALIGMVKDAETEKQTSISRGFSWGWKNWFALFGINFAIYVPFVSLALLVTVLLLAPAIAGFIFKRVILGVVLLILAVFLLLVLLVPSAVGLSLIAILSERFRVLEELRVFQSIKKGYRAIRTNLGTVLLFWLIMVLIGFGLSVIFLPITLLLLAPAAAFFFVDKVLLTIALGIPGVLILIFLSGIIQAFSSAAWTEFFLELTREEKLDIQSASF
jgi:hypothetical protein